MGRRDLLMRLNLVICLALLGGARPWEAGQPAWAQEANAEADENAEQDVDIPAEAEEPMDEPAPDADQPADAENAAAAAAGEDGAPADVVESDFSRYLHFALIGQFEIANNYAESLLKQPALNPLSDAGANQLVVLTDKYTNSIDTLLLMIDNTSIADNARKVLDLVREAHRRQRQAPSRINDSIALLAGTPTQRATAMERLLDSGEYAVPWLLEALMDPARQELRPFIVRALPHLGRKALNPLLAALKIDNPDLQRVIVETLGKIGYAQSLPYLRRLATDSTTNEVVRQVAVAAIGNLVLESPALADMPPADLFARQAEQYYVNLDSLQADPREDRANVWFAREGTVKPVEVPREIFHLVMCMRTCQASLELQPDQAGTVAMWLAANFRREAQLGLDVQNEEVAKTADLTRPPDFLRSVYFARVAGPRHCQLVLQCGIADRNRNVALGAIAALNGIAGPAVMVDAEGKGDLSLAAALRFPDLLVRIRAALALAAARPTEAFKGADEVVPVLGSALDLKGRKYYLLIEPDDQWRQALVAELDNEQVDVIAAKGLTAGLIEACKKASHLDGVFIGSDVNAPPVVDAIRDLSQDARFGLTPVVVYLKEGQNFLADRIAEVDSRVGRLLAVTVDALPAEGFSKQLVQRLSEVAGLYGYQEMDEAESVGLALESAAALREIVACGSGVFDVAAARGDLIVALEHPSEELRTAAIEVLAGLADATSQQAIAVVALSDKQSKPLRQAAYAGLAESARRFGSHLDAATIERLTGQALAGEDLELRTAASQALGAVGISGAQAAQIITATR